MSLAQPASVGPGEESDDWRDDERDRCEHGIDPRRDVEHGDEGEHGGDEWMTPSTAIVRNVAASA
jgi:hypothetical protein